MEYAFRSTARVLVVLTVLALCAGTLWAQGTGELSGLITDQTGAVVAGATVNLSHTATDDKRTATTTGAGSYHFSALPVGSYTLTVAAKGFKGVKVADVVVTVATTTSRDLKLEVGTASEQVTVEAGAQLVQTEDASVSGLVDRLVWQQMPLETRSQNEFIGLLAGAEPAAQANLGTDRGAAVNGTRSGTGNYMVEGFDNNDQGLGGGGSLVGPGGANTTISPDAIEEYRVVEHNFAAEYGKAGGFVTDTVLKSGTNAWHGSLFEYNRIQKLAANDFFSNRAQVKDHLVRNQFGGSVGGPIIKDKTFFYFTTEFHRLRTSSPLQGNSVTPDFLNFIDNGGLEQWAEGTGPYTTLPVTGPCRAFTASADNPNGFACPGGFPDAATQGPIFKNKLLKQPLPLCVPGAANCSSLTNIGSGLWTAGLTYPVDEFGSVTVPQAQTLNQARYSVKLDHKLTSKDQLAGTFLYDNADSVTQWAGGDSTFGPDLPNHGRAINAGVNWTHTFSPTVLNQARMSYTRHTADFPGDATQNAAGTPSIVTAFDAFQGAFGNASNLPQFFTENRFDYRDDLSWSRGKHNLKFGGDYARTRNGSSFQANFNGFFLPYGIEDLATDMKFSDNLDSTFFGYPLYGSWFYAEASINPTVTPATRPEYYRGFRSNEFAFYGQDDWRVSSRLTVNLGLRWEYFGPPHNFKPNLDSNYYSGPAATPILCTVGGAQVPCDQRNEWFPVNNKTIAAFATGSLQLKNHDIWNKDTNNFAPRFGFSWDMFGNQKTVLRGGGGIAYDRMYNNIFENIRFNPPYFCFCNFGTFINGVPGGGNATPGIYTVPFSSFGLFNDPTLFPVLPKTSPRAISQHLVTAYYEQINFGVQHQLGRDFVWETNYVGTFGHKLLGVLNLNTYPGRTAGGVNPSGGTNHTTRPNSAVNNINLRTNCCDSNYHGLQTTLRKRFSNGLQFNVNYTWAKAMDEISDVFTPRGQTLNPTDSFNPQVDYGPADFNVKSRIVGSYNYDLPILKQNRWLGGWSTSGIISWQTGAPFSPWSNALDPNKNGTLNDRIALTSGTLSSVYTGKGPADGYFDPNAFGDVTCPSSMHGGAWCEGRASGQLSRNSLVGPRYTNVDMGVAKRFKINERAGIQFQANFFNLFNHANFRLPDEQFSDCSADPTTKKCTGTFGKSLSDFSPRVTQLALRFDF